MTSYRWLRLHRRYGQFGGRLGAYPGVFHAEDADTLLAHILDQLLAKGHSVVTTVRSEEKAAKIREAYPSQAASGDLTVVIVPDIAQPDAFDEVVKVPGLEVVLHTASPFHFKFSPSLLSSIFLPPT